MSKSILGSVSIPRILASAWLFLGLSVAGCSSGPSATVAPGGTEVVGTLVAVKDDRPVDGGVDLTLETALGQTELVRVPSMFIAGPRDTVMEMHAVVDQAKIGDRIRARGTRDASGALVPYHLELVRSPFQP